MVITVDGIEKLIDLIEKLIEGAPETTVKFLRKLLDMLYELLQFLQQELALGVREFYEIKYGEKLYASFPDWKMSLFLLILFYILCKGFEYKPIPYSGNPPKPGTWVNPLTEIHVENAQKLIAYIKNGLRKQLLGRNESVVFVLLLPNVKVFFKKLIGFLKKIMFGSSTR